MRTADSDGGVPSFPSKKSSSSAVVHAAVPSSVWYLKEYLPLERTSTVHCACGWPPCEGVASASVSSCAMFVEPCCHFIPIS